MYCALTKDSLLAKISERDLIGITDDADTGGVDAAIVNAAIADADAEIDAYARAQYTTPFDPVPAIITGLSEDLAIYHLFSRRGSAPDTRQKRYDSAVRFLRDLSKGIVSIESDGAPGGEASYPDGIASTRTPSERIFTRDSMRDF